jgi:hypothetical protein
MCAAQSETAESALDARWYAPVRSAETFSIGELELTTGEHREDDDEREAVSKCLGARRGRQ